MARCNMSLHVDPSLLVCTLVFDVGMVRYGMEIFDMLEAEVRARQPCESQEQTSFYWWRCHGGHPAGLCVVGLLEHCLVNKRHGTIRENRSTVP